MGYVTPSYTPWRRGFDSAYGFFASGVDYNTKCSYKSAPPTDTRPLSWCRQVEGNHLYDWFEAADGEEPSYFSPGHARYNTTYLTTLHVQRAQSIILEHNLSRPLFLFLSFAAVHSPLQATPDLLARVDAVRAVDHNYFQGCGWFDWGALRNPMPLNPVSPLPCAPRPLTKPQPRSYLD